MLTAMAASVSTEGTSRVNPSVYLRPIAQPISINPATNSMNQAMTNPPSKGQGRPRA